MDWWWLIGEQALEWYQTYSTVTISSNWSYAYFLYFNEKILEIILSISYFMIPNIHKYYAVLKYLFGWNNQKISSQSVPNFVSIPIFWRQQKFPKALFLHFRILVIAFVFVIIAATRLTIASLSAKEAGSQSHYQ